MNLPAFPCPSNRSNLNQMIIAFMLQHANFEIGISSGIHFVKSCDRLRSYARTAQRSLALEARGLARISSALGRMISSEMLEYSPLRWAD
jgi:hypothetical protein